MIERVLNTRGGAFKFLADARDYVIRQVAASGKVEPHNMDSIRLLGSAMTAVETGADHCNF